jgi:hypothetical protein
MRPEQIRMRIADYQADPEMGAAWHRWSEGTVLELLDVQDKLILIHSAMPIYDECECTEDQKSEGHTEVEDVGLTCNLLYYICLECCTENTRWPQQAEWCMDKHQHRHGDLDPWRRCMTVRIVKGLEL